MKIIQQFITKDDSYQKNLNAAALAENGDKRYQTFQTRGPLGLMLHSVGCNQPSAKSFADRWNQPGREASVHAVLQADGTVYQCMPWNFRAWHCGGDASNTHVGVEMTEPGCIHYPDGGSRFTCSDPEAAKEQVRGTYNTAAELFAHLCRQYKLDPMTAIISHAEGNKKGIASNHGDPEHLWNGLGMGYTMDGFRKEVKRRMEDEMTREDVQKMIDTSTKSLDDKIASLTKELKTVRADLDKLVKKFNDYRPIVSESLKSVKKNAVDKAVTKAKEYCDKQLAKLKGK